MSAQLKLGRQWLLKAKNDLLNADNNLKAAQIPLDTVCFHCQQAAEKLLKAYLAAKGQTWPITHDLFLILEKILPFNAAAERLRDDLAVLMPYAVDIRYPDDSAMPSGQDASEARQAAGHVLKWLETILPKLFQENQDD